jgi:hypothetical protein
MLRRLRLAPGELARDRAAGAMAAGAEIAAVGVLESGESP